MKATATYLVVAMLTFVAVDPGEIFGKWRFSKIDDGDGTVLDLERLGGIGAEWTFFEDGTLLNHAEEQQGRWELKDKTLTVEFDAPGSDSKRWKIHSINDKEMVVRRQLKNGKTSTEHLKRLAED